MSIRDILKTRAEARDKAQARDGNNLSGDFPEGVTRYVTQGRNGELNSEGRTFINLRDPNDWYAYFVHEDGTWDSKTKRYDNKFQKHTCLHSPDEDEAVLDYMDGNGEVCPTCAAMTSKRQRKLYFMIPVYDAEYDEFRVIDTKEFHAENIIKAYDSIENSLKKHIPDYSLVGEPIKIFQDDKTYSLTSGDFGDDEKEAEAKEKAQAYIDGDKKAEIELKGLSNVREPIELVDFVNKAEGDSLDKEAVKSFVQEADSH